MAKRTTVYNNSLTSDEDWAKVHQSNKKLLKDFLSYLASCDKSPNTIYQYEQQLRVFFIWNLKNNDNVRFVMVKKREFVNFLGYGRNELNWSPNRLASFRAVLSSLSNYIERILDDEYPTFRNVIKILEPINVEPVREKTILTADQIEDMAKKLYEKGDYQKACWIAILFSSGMRKSEVAQMKVEFFTKDALVFDGLMYRTPKIRTKGRGKQGKQVPRYVFAYTFDKYFDKWMEQRKELGINNEYLFVVKHGEEWMPAKVTTFNSWAQTISDEFDIEFYGHCMRHAFTTDLKKRGYPESVIQKLQNWASLEMVNHYDDTSDEEALDDFFAKTDTKGNLKEEFKEKKL